MFDFIRVCIKVLRINVFRIKIIKCVCVELVPNSRFLARRSDANETRYPETKRSDLHEIKRGKVILWSSEVDPEVSPSIYLVIGPSNGLKPSRDSKQSCEITRGSRESQAPAEGQAQVLRPTREEKMRPFGFGLPRPTNTAGPESAQTLVCLSLLDANLLAPIAENIKYHHEME